MNSPECKIYYKEKFVYWTIPKNCIENTLLGTSKNKGLLFLKVESAGEIEFKDTSCKINSNNIKLCDKTMTTKLKFKIGDNDSVMTPLAIVNFHTHPLNCYIEGKTIWGWPSGEDLGQCLNFANDNNLTHIIFAIEGTYIIDVNKYFLHYIQTNKKLFTLIKNNIQEIFKLSHKHRMYYNDSNNNVTLEDEFNEIFLKPLNMSSKENILLTWINLVNNLTLEKLIILSNQFSKYFNDIKTIPIKLIDFKYINLKIFSIMFYRNETIQWNINLSKNKLFSLLNKNKKKLDIKLPSVIKYTAPFISENCKL